MAFVSLFFSRKRKEGLPLEALAVGSLFSVPRHFEPSDWAISHNSPLPAAASFHGGDRVEEKNAARREFQKKTGKVSRRDEKRDPPQLRKWDKSLISLIVARRDM